MLFDQRYYFISSVYKFILVDILSVLEDESVLMLIWQVLGETGTVMSEDSDSDVRVEVCGRVWTFNAACCTRLPRTAKPPDKKQSSEDSDEAVMIMVMMTNNRQ